MAHIKNGKGHKQKKAEMALTDMGKIGHCLTLTFISIIKKLAGLNIVENGLDENDNKRLKIFLCQEDNGIDFQRY